MSLHEDKITSIFLKYRRAISRILTRYARPSDIEDVIQDTWLKVSQASIQKEIEYPKTYMVRTAINLAKDLNQSAARRYTDSLDKYDLDSLQLEHGDQCFQRVESMEKLELFCKSLRVLPPTCRKVFVLKKVYGLSQKEISEQMNISESAVEKHVAKGLFRSKRYLKSIQESEKFGVAGGFPRKNQARFLDE